VFKQFSLSLVGITVNIVTVFWTIRLHLKIMAVPESFFTLFYEAIVSQI